MRLPIVICQFSNFLFFTHKSKRFTDQDLQKYLTAENIDLHFYGKSQKEIWTHLNKTLDKQRAKQFKKEIGILKPDFTLFWNKFSKNLLSWKKYFQDKQSLFWRAMQELKQLTGVTKFSFSNIPIYLVCMPRHGRKIEAWFSWTPKQSFLVIEIPANLNAPSGDLFPLAILTHEFFHLLLRKNKKLFLSICQAAVKNKKLLIKPAAGIPERFFLEELLVSSFIPEGYLGEKFFNLKIPRTIAPENDLLTWRKFVARKLRQTTKEYADGGVQINQKYINDVMMIVGNIK